jgi:hypothetical protein
VVAALAVAGCAAPPSVETALSGTVALDLPAGHNDDIALYGLRVGWTNWLLSVGGATMIGSNQGDASVLVAADACVDLGLLGTCLLVGRGQAAFGGPGFSAPPPFWVSVRPMIGLWSWDALSDWGMTIGFRTGFAFASQANMRLLRIEFARRLLLGDDESAVEAIDVSFAWEF